MAQTEPILDFIVENTYDTKTLAIRDISFYPSNFNIISPFLEINVPGKGDVRIVYTPNSLNVLNSAVLGITKTGSPLGDIPDGIYTIKYSINPAYKNYVSKNIIRVDKLNDRFSGAFIAFASQIGDSQLSRNNRMKLDEIEMYINGAVASANRCANKLAMELYRKASKLLDELEKGCKNC